MFMKNINVVFEDREYRQLIKKKANLNWHDFIMKLSNGGVKHGVNKQD